MFQKTVLITGVSRGIGRACALTFARAGYAVAGCCRSRTDLLDSLSAELSAIGVPHLFLTGDVADTAFVDDLFSQTITRFKHLDVLINNAGISHIGLLTDMTDEQWNRLLSVNLSSAFYCCRAAIPHLLANRDRSEVLPEDACGTILNVSSVWGCSGASCEAAYSASKAGLNALTSALAKELAPSRIAVNALACGVIDTDMNHCFSEEERAALREEIPANRFASPEEAAKALLLLSQMPAYLTGQVIRFDGGFL
ncbi:MAG: SDR family oxidoreductase [Lachnospiraceae bacterium]|nr:SDR family oxidoreductase [Lachnospiraceae bacterium]